MYSVLTNYQLVSTKCWDVNSIQSDKWAQWGKKNKQPDAADFTFHFQMKWFK